MPNEGREKVAIRGVAYELTISFRMAERLVRKAREEHKGKGELRGTALVAACRELLKKEKGL